jgi:hypothetical protein
MNLLLYLMTVWVSWLFRLEWVVTRVGKNKEGVVACFNLSSPYDLWSMGNHKTQKMAGLPAQIWMRDVPITKKAQ